LGAERGAGKAQPVDKNAVRKAPVSRL